MSKHTYALKCEKKDEVYCVFITEIRDDVEYHCGTVGFADSEKEAEMLVRGFTVGFNQAVDGTVLDKPSHVSRPGDLFG